MAVDVQQTARQIQAAHAFAALATGLPDLSITDDQAKALAKAYKDVSDHYGVSALPPGVMLWLNVLTVAASVYGPKVVSIGGALAAKKAAQKRAGGSKTSIVVPPGAAAETRQSGAGMQEIDLSASIPGLTGAAPPFDRPPPRGKMDFSGTA